MRRFQTSRVVAVAAATWLSLAMLSTESSRAVADGGEPIGDTQVVTLDGTFSPPKVGQLPELAGPGFIATSIQAAFYGQVSTDSGEYSPASAGDQLLYLSANLYSFALPLGTSEQTYEPDFAPALAVNFAGSSVALPQSPDGSINGVAGSAYGDQGELYAGQWLVALPKDAPVSLSANEDGFTQTVDIRNATRIGEAPTVLYRSPAGPLALDVRPNLAGTVVVDAGGSRVSFPVTMQEAFLGYFDLSNADDTPATAPDQAYLFAEVSIGTGVDSQGRADWYLDPSAPAQSVTVAADGGPAEMAVRAPAAPSSDGVGDTGSPSGGLFGFTVPAGLTSASLDVGTGPDPSVYYQGPDDYAATEESVNSSTPATFKVSFPAASPAPTAIRPPSLAASSSASPPATAISQGTTTPSTVQFDQPASTSRRHSGPGWWPVGVGAGADTTIIVLAGLFISRRTRLVEAKPVAPESEAAPEAGGGVEGGASTDGRTPDDLAITTGGTGDAIRSCNTGARPFAPLVRVGVLGPLVVEGTGDIRRKVVLRALIVLALFLGKPIRSEELRGWLADGEYSEPSAGTLRSELSRLRRVLPEGLLPELGTTAGYALAAKDVDVDWDNFTNFASQANHAEGNDRVEFGLKALRLIRGRVLENRSWHGIDRMVWDMNVSIEDLAAEIATEALAACRPAEAAEASRLGLKAVPSGRLWQLRVQAAEAGSGEDVRNLSERASVEG